MRRNVVIALCLAGCLLACAVHSDAQSPAPKTSPAPSKCVSVPDYLASIGFTLGTELSKLVTDKFNGTVFVPTNAALTAVVNVILAEASKIAGKPVTIPAGLDLFALEELKDVLKLHIVPNVPVDPTALKPSDFPPNRITITIPLDTTSLSSVKKQSLCPNTTTAELSVIVKAADTSPAVKLEKVTIIAAGSNATVVNASVGTLCDGVVHIIDTVLLPCPTNESVIPTLARTLAATATPIPGVSPKVNGTAPMASPSPKPSSAAFSGMSIGTMVAALCAVMIMSGSTVYVVIGSLIMVAGGFVTLANV